LSEIEDAYDEDLDTSMSEEDTVDTMAAEQQEMGGQEMAPGMGMM
jgi:hypothetical protein